jgi:thiamine pyrophosphate-dependent acetolactate synthase large subunit-like protein
MKNDLPRAIDTEVPAGLDGEPKEIYGSDGVAEILRALDVPYITLNPGASFRGLHDSLVNYLGNTQPQMLLCLHEESAVAIAHGYAKASGRMMAVALHSNVGLLHASMAMYNAWCDRSPIMIFGASGPFDADKRRPWIDWIHTCTDQGALTRDFTKWDNQPASVPAAYEAVLRAAQIATTAPAGPVYINLDVTLQETRLDKLPPLPDVSRFKTPQRAAASPESLDAAAKLLDAAKRVVIFTGRSARTAESWDNRVALAEKLQAYVISDMKPGATFPTAHPLHLCAGGRLTAEEQKAVREADVVLGLECVDLGGQLRMAFGKGPVSAKVINASCDVYNHRAFSTEYQMLPPVDVHLLCDADAAVAALLRAVKIQKPAAPKIASEPAKRPAKGDELCIYDIAQAFNQAAEGMDVCLSKLPIGWNSKYRDFKHPLDFLGGDGGGGLGAGPGVLVGAALALKGTGRIVAGVHGDGDFLMGATALWTAVRYKLPCLSIISNNRGYYNDEAHQEVVAKTRSRPVENKGIGQRLTEPDIDLAMMARSQGAVGIGPVTTQKDLLPAIKQGLQAVRDGKVCVIDVRVAPGYEG